jgi:hypothetical protein
MHGVGASMEAMSCQLQSWQLPASVLWMLEQRAILYAGFFCSAIGVTDAAIALAISSSTEKMSLTSRS